MSMKQIRWGLSSHFVFSTLCNVWALLSAVALWALELRADLSEVILAVQIIKTQETKSPSLSVLDRTVGHNGAAKASRRRD